MKHVIFAPHVDDEVIGCFTLLRGAPDDCLVVYLDVAPVKRRAEAVESSHYLRFKTSFASANDSHWSEAVHTYLTLVDYRKAVWWAPDPHWELHPFHKDVGARVRAECARFGRRFGTYSTNMNAPYIRELDINEMSEKKDALRSYPSQASLWEHDHRYFLFEGRVEWNPPV